MKAKTRKRDKLMKTKNIAFTTILLLLSCVTFTFTTQADPPSQHVVTQFHQTVLGTQSVNGELVDFSGMIHVVVDVEFSALPPDPCRVHANLSDVVGVGRDTGGTYHADGATDSDFMVDLSEGLSLEADYLIPPGPPDLPPDPCRVFISIAFDQSGHATALSAVIGPR
jgi:hypothetical protein